LSLAISFLAGFLNLGNISSKIMEVIEKARATVDKGLDAGIAWVVSKAKAFIGKAKTAVAQLFNWGATKSKFTDESGVAHSVFVQVDGTPRLAIASTPQPAAQFLEAFLKGQSAEFKTTNEAKIAAVRAAIADADLTIKDVDAAMKAGKDEAALAPLQNVLLEKNIKVSAALSGLVGKNPLLAEAREHYLLEGVTGTYASIPKPKSDDLTADHQPQAAILELAATFASFSKDGPMAKRAQGRAQEGRAVNLSTTRHKAGSTFGFKGKITKEDFKSRVNGPPENLSPQAQRKLVVAEIRKDLNRDVDAMLKIGNSNAKTNKEYWSDVLPTGKDEDRAAVIADIGKRIVAAEHQMKAQDIESLANE
jgi:hypothetical protein